MTHDPAVVPAGMPSSAGNPAAADRQRKGWRRPGNTDTAVRIELAHPGYHVWVSDAGWWYATRTQSWARGQAATVHGPGPGELCGALAKEEAATMGRAMAGAW